PSAAGSSARYAAANRVPSGLISSGDVNSGPATRQTARPVAVSRTSTPPVSPTFTNIRAPSPDTVPKNSHFPTQFGNSVPVSRSYRPNPNSSTATRLAAGSTHARIRRSDQTGDAV